MAKQGMKLFGLQPKAFIKAALPPVGGVLAGIAVTEGIYGGLTSRWPQLAPANKYANAAAKAAMGVGAVAALHAIATKTVAKTAKQKGQLAKYSKGAAAGAIIAAAAPLVSTTSERVASYIAAKIAGTAMAPVSNNGAGAEVIDMPIGNNNPQLQNVSTAGVQKGAFRGGGYMIPMGGSFSIPQAY